MEKIIYYWLTVLAVALVSSSASAKDCVLWEKMKFIEDLRVQSMILWIEEPVVQYLL